MKKPKDISNQQFGRLTALRYIAKSRWECVCTCGTKATALYNQLTSGKSKSCGCLRKETKRGKSTPKTHCKQGHPLTEESSYKLTSGYLACRACELARATVKRRKRGCKAKEG